MRINVRYATPEESASIEPFDFSKLSAINTCPTWGILRYGLHKTLYPGATSAALAAGSASHEVYAAARLWQLAKKQQLPQLARTHGIRLFGETRYSLMEPHLAGDDRSNFMGYCLEALYSYGLVDDPSEKRKSLAKVEESCIAYLDRILDEEFKHPVWVENAEDPQSRVGIELPFDLALDFIADDGTVARTIRFFGKIDGLHWHGDELWLHENKTASRLNDAWIRSFALSHQVTGYALAASFIAQYSIEHCRVHGMAIPLPRSGDYGGLLDEDVHRAEHHLVQWFVWLQHTIDLYYQYKENPATAPKYTHSCNRYFRPCMFIDYCAGDDAEKEEVLDMYETEEWSPIEEKAGD